MCNEIEFIPSILWIPVGPPVAVLGAIFIVCVQEIEL
jgi:hypothetical protein